MLADSQDKGLRFLLVAAAFVILVGGLKSAAGVILPFLVSVFFALISLPLLNWLRSKNIPTPVAVAATLFVALSVLALIVMLLGGTVGDFTDQVPKYQERLARIYERTLQDSALKSTFDWLRTQGIDLESLGSNLINPGRALDFATGTLRGVRVVLTNTFLVLLYIMFILFEAAGFPDKLSVAFGAKAGSERFEKIKSEIQRYLATKTVISLATGMLITIALSIIGVDFALLWGALAFLLNYIPNLGSIIAAIPPVLLAIVQLGFGEALAVAIVFVAVNVLLGSLIEPHLMGRRLGLSTLVVLLSLVFWGWVWGPIGMLLSVPLTMIVKIMLENTSDLRWIAVLLGSSPRAGRS